MPPMFWQPGPGGGPAESRRSFPRITRTIFLTGNLSPEQQKRIMEIADKCPVHRTLHSSVLVETELADTI